MLLLPDGDRARIKARADANGRSMNAEIVEAIQQHLASNFRERIESRVTRIEERLGL